MTSIFKRSAIVAVALSTIGATGVLAMDDKVVQKGGPDLTQARVLIKAKNWTSAVKELKGLEAKGPNADVYSLLGFSHRKQGKFDESYAYYQKALKLDPKHKGAHEYLGELFIQKGDIASARKQAAILAELCPQGCEEREDLDEALEKATK